MIKKIFVIVYLTIIPVFLYTLDNKENDKIKFRGKVSLLFAYYFCDDPVNINNHISLINYNFYYDYTDKDQHDDNDPGRIIKPNFNKIEGKINFDYSIILPCLRFDKPFLKNNNITCNFYFYLTPVTFAGGCSLAIELLPFLEISGGFLIGTGWNISSIGAYGLARINYGSYYNDEDNDVLINDSFKTALIKSWISLKLQFDLSAVLNKKYKRWAHLLLAVKSGFYYTVILNYGYYEKSFYWETRETFNRWEFKTDFILGYKIPIIEDPRKKEAEQRMFLGYAVHNDFSISAVLWTSIELPVTHFNESKMQDKGWGSDFITVKFGPNVVFDLPYNISFLIGFHWKNEKSYSSNTIGNADLFKKEYIDWYIKFDRIAISLSWGF